MDTVQETVLSVEGMNCSSCVRHVEGALRALNGIHSIEVRLREGKVRIEHEGQSSVAAMVDALLEVGYESKPDPLRQ